MQWLGLLVQEPPKKSGAANVFSSVIQKLEQQYVVRASACMLACLHSQSHARQWSYPSAYFVAAP